MTCIPALTHRPFSSIRMREEATARHRRVSPLLPGKSTHTAQAVLIPGQDHTQLPHGTGSHCALYAARAPFDWESHTSGLSMEKLHVSELCTALYPRACLPARASSLKDGKVTTVLGKKDAADHCDRNF